MRTTRQYLSGCTWCKAEGYVMEPHPQITGDFHKVCPVCNSSKVITVTEIIETNVEVIREIPEKYEPYFGWCDVGRCKNEGCSGGVAWRETGYWTVCTEHSASARNGDLQPKMKQAAIKREKSRDKKTGCLTHQ